MTPDCEVGRSLSVDLVERFRERSEQNAYFSNASATSYIRSSYARRVGIRCASSATIAWRPRYTHAKRGRRSRLGLRPRRRIPGRYLCLTDDGPPGSETSG